MKKFIFLCTMLVMFSIFSSAYAKGKIGDDDLFWYYYQNSVSAIKGKSPVACYPEYFSTGDSFSCVMDYESNSWNDQEMYLLVMNDVFGYPWVDLVLLNIPPWYLGTDNPYGDQVLKAAAQMGAEILGLGSNNIVRNYMDKSKKDTKYYVIFKGKEGCEITRENDMSITVACTYPYTNFDTIRNK